MVYNTISRIDTKGDIREGISFILYVYTYRCSVAHTLSLCMLCCTYKCLWQEGEGGEKEEEERGGGGGEGGDGGDGERKRRKKEEKGGGGRGRREIGNGEMREGKTIRKKRETKSVREEKKECVCVCVRVRACLSVNAFM